MEKCANAIADWLVCCAMIDEEDKELYGYAAYSLILSISPLLLAIVFGICMGRVKESVMITLPFMLIRKFSGGYHTKHAWSCMICSCLLLFLCITLSSYITAGWLFNFFTIGATVSLICFSPIEHENKVLDQEEHIRYKKITAILAIGCIFVIIFLNVIHLYALSVCLSIGLILTAGLQWPVVLLE